jgi:hypothetical protein
MSAFIDIESAFDNTAFDSLRAGDILNRRQLNAAAALGYGQVGHCPTKYLKKHKSFVLLRSL